MEYPLISEYREAILSAEDNFSELTSLRPVLDSHGDPVMSSGNFAVVFKMKDETDGKLYAVKCFIKDQEGRDESYRKIADELEVISSAYILPLRYLENELFVDSAQCTREEFPVVVMEWVEGETLDAYLKRHLTDKYELEMLSYRFNRMAAWLLAQPFAHGDLKPDNILVRKDGSLALVDYDGMFVPTMKEEKAREIGSPDYRHPLRTDSDFNEHIDDFSIAVIALSLKAIALDPQLKSEANAGDALLLSAEDFRSPADSVMLQEIQKLTNDTELALLSGIFYIALSQNSLASLSFRLFMTAKPKQPAAPKKVASTPPEKIDTTCTEEDIKAGIADECDVIYSPDGKRLLKCDPKLDLIVYSIKPNTQIICDDAFEGCKALLNIYIPQTLTAIGDSVFHGCYALKKINIPKSVTTIGVNPFSGCTNVNIKLSSKSSFHLINNLLIDSDGKIVSCVNASEIVKIPSTVTSIGSSAFENCGALQSVSIPDSVTTIGNSGFRGCKSLQSISIPDSVITIGDDTFSNCESLIIVKISRSLTSIGKSVFENCINLQSIDIPDSVISIGMAAFGKCESLTHVNLPKSILSIEKLTFAFCESLETISIPHSVTYIGDGAFGMCKSLHSIIIPDSVTSIGKKTFYGCQNLQNVTIPNSITYIGNWAFSDCKSLQSITIPHSVISIGDWTFWGCKSLHTAIVPQSIKFNFTVFPKGVLILNH